MDLRGRKEIRELQVFLETLENKEFRALKENQAGLEMMVKKVILVHLETSVSEGNLECKVHLVKRDSLDHQENKAILDCQEKRVTMVLQVLWGQLGHLGIKVCRAVKVCLASEVLRDQQVK